MSSVQDISKKIIKTLGGAYLLIKESRDEITIRKWMKICENNSRLVYKALRRAKNVGERRHFEVTIGLLNHFHNLFKKQLYIGGGSNIKNKLITWKEINSAFKGRIRTTIAQNMGYKDPKLFLVDVGKMLIRRLKNVLKKINIIKMNIVFCCEFKKATTNEEEEEINDYKYLSTANKMVDYGANLNDLIKDMNEELLASLDEFQERDSGWALKRIINLTVNINKHSPLIGSSYIELPDYIKDRKACINVKNNDNACFAWSVVSALYPASHNSDRLTSYPHYTSVLNLNGIEFPIKMKDISKFEKNNNIGINVYTLLKRKFKYEVAPLRISNEETNRINLLLFNKYSDGSSHYEDYDGIYNDNESFDGTLNYHFCWIKNLSRLVSSQVSKRNGKIWICERCLNFFYSEIKLKNHSVDCKEKNECKIDLPKYDRKWIKFKNYNHKERCPFIIYADLESILHPIRKKTCRTERYQEHEVYSIGYYFLCSYNSELNFYRSHRGPNCQEWFINELQQLAEDVQAALLNNVPMDSLSNEKISELNSQSKCHICENEFNEGDIRVIDHCHLTGKVRGMAHQDCNLNYQNDNVIPVVFHNLTGYDSHFIIKEIAQSIKGRVELLPINKEKYIAFTKEIDGTYMKFRFIDSFRFLPTSIEKLASYCDTFEILRKEFPHHHSLLSKKGIFPYDYIDSWKKFEETQLPSKEDFYSNLNATHISDVDYQHALNVW